MLLGFLESPNEFINHLRRYTASLTTQMTFGFRTTTIHEPRFKEAFEIFDRSSEMIGSRTAALLDLVPVLRRLPDIAMPIVREGRAIHQREMKLFRGLFLQAKQGLKDGTAKVPSLSKLIGWAIILTEWQPCVCVDLVKIQKDEGISDELAAYLSGSVLQAGSETTASILVGFVQAMVMYPDVARTAQMELDRVCGDRMPDLNDVWELPYIRACAKESLRWMPGFLLGIPHAVTQDDTYMGYHIPGGSTVIMNVWYVPLSREEVNAAEYHLTSSRCRGVHNDPERHPSPRQFDPMRYINDHQTSVDAANNPDATKRDHFVFGAGRRRCQGMHIADRSIFLAIARLLWAFHFRRAVDQNSGKEILPDPNDLQDGVMALPNPFPTNIDPRSPEKAESIRQEWNQMMRLLDEKDQWKVVPEGLIWKDEQELE
ncbi:MAG: hypothetical protein Q9160_003581 [Pyrenula sp. 1 TL-2023]